MTESLTRFHNSEERKKKNAFGGSALFTCTGPLTEQGRRGRQEGIGGSVKISEPSLRRLAHAWREAIHHFNVRSVRVSLHAF